MRKTISFIVNSSLILLFTPMIVFGAILLPANIGSAASDLQQKRDAFRQEVKQKQEVLRQEIRDKKDVLQQGIQEKREGLKLDVKGKMMNLEQEVKNKREEMRMEVEKKREEMHAVIDKKREEFKLKAQERKDDLKKKLGAQRAERIEQFFNNMVRKFEEAIERLDNNAKRVSAMLDKVAANGRDTTALKSKLEEARAKIMDARQAFEGAKTKYTEAAKDPDFKVAFAKVHEVVAGVAEKVKEAHRALAEVISSIKGLGMIKQPAGTAGTPVTPAPATQPAAQ